MDEKKLENLFRTAQDARLVNLAEHLIYPMLENNITHLIVKMSQKYDAGDFNFIGEVAQLNFILKLKQNLVLMQKKGNEAQAKIEELKK